MHPRRILVVGGAGYVGSHAAKALARAGREPIVFDDMSTGSAEAVKWGPLVRGDMRDVPALREAMRRWRPDAVMHFAARIDAAESQRRPLDYYGANLAGSLALIEAMRAEGVGALVFSSTCAVYGDPGPAPVAETAALAPINVYGRTKLMAEQALAQIAGAHGLAFAALRYFNAAGADPEGEIGDMREDASHLVAVALRAAAGRGPALRIFGTDYATPDGSCVRDFVHVADLADAHVRAVDHLAGQGGVRRFNLGSGEGSSVREVAAAVERATGRYVPIETAPRRPGDAPALRADIALARETLGWRPHRSQLDAVIASAWAWRRRRWGLDEPIRPRAAAGR
jgi:UDP-arabinose 4-epimerase